jgi:polysaccharide biosynthesis transport protein
MPDPAYPNTAMAAYDPEYPAEEPTKDLRDYVAMIRRRKLLIALTAALVAGIALVVAWVLPPSYRSTATILVQEQEIPVDFVRSTVTSYADERISVISQQVMTRQVLLGLVDKYNLYEARRKSETSEEILERMRKDIKLSTVNANVADRRGGSTTGTIAFQLSYESQFPVQAQRVVSELVTLYLNENVKSRQQRAAETSAFLAEESERLGAQISEMEAKLADFKQRNQGRLPELAQANLAAIDRAEAELSRIDQNIVSLEDRKVYLENQLAQVKDLVPLPPPQLTASGEDRTSRTMDPEERLKLLQNQLTSLASIYSEQHPDLVRLRREVAALQKQVGAEGDGAANVKKLAEARQELTVLRDRYSEDHPDVLKLKRTVAALEESASRSPTAKPDTAKKAAAPTGPTRAETQLTIALRSQIDQANAEVRNLRNARKDFQARIKQLEARVQQMPMVEKEYLDLIRDHDNAVARYREIKGKQMQAQVAESLEKDRKAERFSLIDPPQLPEKPVSPNRPVILLVGMLGALVGGFGLGFLREGVDQSVRGVRELARIAQVPVLGTIPYMEGEADRRRKTRYRWVGALIVIVGLLAFLAIVHFFFTPLPVLWYVIERRLGL